MGKLSDISAPPDNSGTGESRRKLPAAKGMTTI